MPRQSRPKRTFGTVEKVQPSGRWRARFVGPDLKRHSAPGTFDTHGDAEAWLVKEQRLIHEDPEGWVPPRKRIAEAHERRRLTALTFEQYATTWLATRKVRGRTLAVRTREHYRSMLTRLLFPTFGDVALTDITPESIHAWYETCKTPEGKLLATRPTQRAQAYGLLKSILASATDPAQAGGARIAFNPASIRGAGSVKRRSTTQIATPAEVQKIADAMPPEYRLMVLLAAWCGLRSGEVRELRRDDVDTSEGVFRVHRQVVRTKEAGMVVRPPKSQAGVRTVDVPASLVGDLRRHLLEHAQPGGDGLLFPSRRAAELIKKTGKLSKEQAREVAQAAHLAPVSLSEMFDGARQAAGRPDLRFHDLRHSLLTYAAQSGATIAELMAIAGHSTPQAALRYQHATSERRKVLARGIDAIRTASGETESGGLD